MKIEELDDEYGRAERERERGSEWARSVILCSYWPRRLHGHEIPQITDHSVIE